MRTYIHFSLLILFSTVITFANWQQTSGPGGGRISCIASNINFIFAAGHIGLYRSADNAVSWNRCGLQDYIINDILIADNELFVITEDGCVFKSTDNGYEFTDVSPSIRDRYPGRCLEFDGSRIYASFGELDNDTPFSFFKSANMGDTWNEVPEAPARIISTGFYQGYLFAGTFHHGIHRYNTQTNIWQEQTTDEMSGAFHVCGSSDDYIFMSNRKYLWRSADLGNQWERCEEGLPQNIWHINGIQSLSGHTYLASGYGVFHSTDQGSQWSLITQGLTCTYAKCITLESTGVFVGTQAGAVQKSTLGGDTFEFAGNGINQSMVYDLLHFNNHIFAGTGRGVFRSGNQGATWQYTGIPNTSVKALAVYDGTLIAASYYDGVFLSDDNGASWDSAEISPDARGNAMHVMDSSIFMGTTGGVYRSDDGGATWQKKSQGIFDIDYTTKNITALFSRGGILFAGSSDIEDVYYVGSFYRSFDNGESWEAPSLYLYHAINAMTYNFGHIYIGKNSMYNHEGVFDSPNYGDYFVWHNTGLEGDAMNVNSLYSYQGLVFAGTNAGIYYIEGMESPWQPYNNGISDYEDVLGFEAEAGNLYASIYRQGVWEKSLEDLSANVQVSVEKPLQTKLTCSPNPFNPVTNISFDLPEQAEVTLSVFNLKGQLIRKLINNKSMATGTHAVVWDGITESGHNTASGMYFCRLTYGNISISRKITLVK